MEKLFGVLIIAAVFAYMWFVSPQEDRFGRFTAKAYGTAIALMFAFACGIYFIIFVS